MPPWRPPWRHSGGHRGQFPRIYFGPRHRIKCSKNAAKTPKATLVVWLGKTMQTGMTQVAKHIKMEQKWVSKRARATTLEEEGATWAPMRAKREPKGAKREPTGSQRMSKTHLKTCPSAGVDFWDAKKATAGVRNGIFRIP